MSFLPWGVQLEDLTGIAARIEQIQQHPQAVPFIAAAPEDVERLWSALHLLGLPEVQILVRESLEPGECYVLDGQGLGLYLSVWSEQRPDP